MTRAYYFSLLVMTQVLATQYCMAQDDVMMQAFYWDVPVDDQNKNGTWWDNLSGKAAALDSAGITGIWVPSPAKGNFGIWDMGYGIFDHYDLGNYDQKGTVETRFGSRAELESMLSTMHDKGIDVYADIVLNHMYTGDSEDESNPAVKQYVFDEAYRNAQQYSPYPTNEIIWVVKNATAGDYYIQIAGYHLGSTNKEDRAYDVEIDYTGSGFNGSYSSESEPNNGNGDHNTFPASGNTIRGFIEVGDIDEYKVSVSSTTDIKIKLTARKEIADPYEWAWADQTNGYYPMAIWHEGSNIAITAQLEAHTNTGVNYVTHTGTGEPNYSWTYNDFHPVDDNDYLGYIGTDEIVTNTKFFGNDINTFSSTVATRFQDWGVWLTNEIGFDGYRLDFVRGIQSQYVADWVKNLPLENDVQRFIVGEYWGPDYRIKEWVNNVAGGGANVNGFDFPLKWSLNDLCNGDGSSYDMRWLNHAGMVRNDQGNSLPGSSVVTWLENHDTGKEHDKWVTKDWKLGYAYILTHEGRPCVFYNHFFGDQMMDSHDNYYKIYPAISLRDDIEKLIFARKTYLGGSLTVLSEIGNPYPAEDAYNVYVARRDGNGLEGEALKSGAIIVISNHDSETKGLWVDSSPEGWGDWSNTKLINAFDMTDTTEVMSDGRVWIEAPARGYAVYVKESEFVNYAMDSSKVQLGNIDEQENSILNLDESAMARLYPNPLGHGSLILNLKTPTSRLLNIKIYDVQGKLRFSESYTIEAGNQDVSLNVEELSPGYYITKVEHGTQQETLPLLIR
ncbi:T9SS type A sorting domain-containing protein [Marinoscillum sp. MHG1-6]|uniref:alpha-amylase family glycosyl hydrolase n=1 Tax=Marinoscillum sp. MHG1-6 TaxID=2959627 RepID=UPI002157D7B5|nr:alpha-amylase family glycosyl hydrolase [Marinoscillum sp. MHG1-6]